MILCIGTSPAAQRVMVFEKLEPGQVNRAAQTLDGVAGKSINVAKVLKTLGQETMAFCPLGGERGAALLQMLQEQQIPLSVVKTTSNTRQCITVIDLRTGLQTELVEESPVMDPGVSEILIQSVRKHLPKAKAVVMSGTIAPGCPADLYYQVTKMAREAGVMTVVDAQGAALTHSLKAGPTLVKPNRIELAATLGRKLDGDKAIAVAMRKLCCRGVGSVVVTAGKEPALACDGNQIWRFHPPDISAVNPIGSGDAFTAALVWRLVGGDTLQEACRWGTAAGSANALTMMPGEVVMADVQRLSGLVNVEMVDC